MVAALNSFKAAYSQTIQRAVLLYQEDILLFPIIWLLIMHMLIQ